MAPPISLFPPRPTASFSPEPRLQGGVDTAIAEIAKARGGTVQFSIALIDLDSMKWGAYKPDQMDYVASSVKVAAMLAAFALRDMARRFVTVRKAVEAAAAVAGAVAAAASGIPLIGGAVRTATAPPAKPVGLFDALRKHIDPEIDAASPKQLVAVQRTHRVPKYEQVFAAQPKGGGWTSPDFSGSFRESMKAMIVPSDNAGAGRCVRGVGYGYLNGLLEHFGLFDPKTATGVWLAGDYVSQYPYVRISSVNDAGVAQAGSALGMGKMMALIVNRACIDTASCDDMRGLLAEAAKGIDQPFLTRDAVSDRLRIPLEKVTHCKLGFGPLKKGGNVASEIFRMEDLRKKGKSYVVSYQNVGDDVRLGDVAFAVHRALEVYE
jgi:hypothetical protein